MDYMELNEGKVKITAMGIADFLVGVSTKLKEGYELNYEDNDMYPIAYGGFFEVVLGKVSARVEGEEKVVNFVEEVQDKEVEVKRGRKAKSE